MNLLVVGSAVDISTSSPAACTAALLCTFLFLSMHAALRPQSSQHRRDAAQSFASLGKMKLIRKLLGLHGGIEDKIEEVFPELASSGMLLGRTGSASQ